MPRPGAPARLHYPSGIPRGEVYRPGLSFNSNYSSKKLNENQHRKFVVQQLARTNDMESVNRFLYGPSPEERVRKWQAKIRTEERQMDREIRGIETAQNKVKIQLKQLAAKNDLKNCKMLAKEIVRSNKQKDRLFTSKARLNSIRMQLQHQLATLKISGTLQKSTEIMKLSNSLMKLPELSKTMQEMSKEMMKAGIMSEMVEDAIDTLDEDEEELEEEAEAEVQNVLFNITDGKLGQMGAVGSKLPQSAEPSQAVQEEDLEDLGHTRKRAYRQASLQAQGKEPRHQLGKHEQRRPCIAANGTSSTLLSYKLHFLLVILSSN
ncbi:hypothetical protein PCANC_09364 [Puccinia coronata f. sp. avenae]|uniref:Charged multivesicular body protein 3 n=1 Tax=Puccinia coronata f. sp. avenae TaxID=200324 RepID=A0A2N5URU1_9BASI|nr:hypothetical protein PCANC_09462 [Puccinia coronata f. sp. avenae]PLW40462.1 hypothetical protein PCANC_09364 [Puccinia coronata f. sp. avenae]